MGRTPMSGGSAFRFLPSEVADMEKALDASSGATPARSIVEALADKFTNSSDRNGREVQWKQVWNWFQNRRHAQKAKIDKLKAVGSSVETPPAAPKPVPVPVAGSGTVKKIIDVPMDFEAKSARDGAWYDVSAFITKRDSESGEPEVKVRFAGFGSEEDEWVNIATAIRQRSLPCETTECVAVLPGDLILCFQEGSEQALYFDADILDVQRRRHDVRGCRCRFWVRYRHDQTEEVVPLRKVCRRPETEQRLQLVREVSKLSNKDTAMERPLNGTPSINTPQLPPTTPASAATATQLGTVFNAMHLQGTSPNLYTPVQQGTSTQPMQPIPMQSLTTPDAMASIHQQAAHPPVAPASTVTPVQAIASSQGPTLSTPIAAAQSTIIQELTASVPIPPSIESSISQQLTISAPAELQSRPAGAGVEPSVTQEQSTGVPGNSGVAETSNLAQPMETVSGVSSIPAVDPIGPAPAITSADVGLPSGSNVATAPTDEGKSLVSKDLPTIPVDESTMPVEPTRLGEAAVPPVIAPVSTLPE